ncbi:hypothetical protein C1Y40_00611 [Mycobacterium talmoniae]|uniref:Uncharacterized protein n=1 Tax=Mycobacterium talmoniae TaxID=1858794 RepID=A0A2S8BR75_9MYCO|nr:hypothetical protein C1Y40_00611 [Mycobacterium talmoniae]
MTAVTTSLIITEFPAHLANRCAGRFHVTINTSTYTPVSTM